MTASVSPEVIEPRTSRQIVDQTLEIARIIYSHRGYVVAEGFRFYESQHPQEYDAWYAACEIQEFMTGTDAEDALAELEDDESED